MSSLLIDDNPIIILPKLACAIGVSEAVLLQQIHFWLKHSSNERDGRKWVFNTIPEWNKQFPFWGESTIKRALANLRERGLVLATDQYNRHPVDRKLWYTIDYDAVEVLENTPTTSHQVKMTRPSGQNDLLTSGQNDLLTNRDIHKNTIIAAHANAVLDDSQPTATYTQKGSMATKKQHSPNILPLMVERKPETLGHPLKGNTPQPPPQGAAPPPSPKPGKRAKKAESNPQAEACWQAYLLKIEEYEPGATLNFARERKAINDLAKQWTPEQVSECFDKMKADSFWADKHLSVQSIASQIAAKMNGHAAKTSGHERIDPDLFFKNFSQGDLYS